MGKQPLVYLVDDDPSARTGLKRLLLTAGYEVNEFASASELLEDDITEKNACLILDARMPDVSGLDLHMELTARGVHLPTIFVTADDDPQTRNRAMKFEAAGFFRKPVDGAALLDAVVWALKTHKSKK